MLNSISSLAFKASSANKKRNKITRPADLRMGDIFSIKNTPDDKKAQNILFWTLFRAVSMLYSLAPSKFTA